MQPVVRQLIMMHSDPELCAQLGEIPGQLYQLSRVEDWTALRAALRRAPHTTVAVVDPYLGTGGEQAPAEELRTLLHDFPSATVLPSLHATPFDVETLRTLLEWGAADVVALPRECTVPALMHRLRSVRSRLVERLLRRALPRGVPGRTHALLRRAAEVVAAGGDAKTLADVLGVSVRTVPRWCARADLPPPRRLLAWLRLLLAGDLLDDPGRSISAAARVCGYSGETTLKNAIRDFLGLTPRELRDRGAFATVARAFGAELAELRDAAYARGRSGNVWLN